MKRLAVAELKARWEKERLQAELETQSLFRLLVENVKDYAVFMMDSKGDIVSWNRASERILGYLENEIIGQNFSIIFTAEDRAAEIPQSELRKAQMQGRADDFRWHVRKAGNRFWAEGVVTPLWDENGELRGFSKLLRDNTEQKRHEELLATCIEAAPSAMLMVNEKGNAVLANKQLEVLSGYSRAELMKLKVEDLVPDQLRERHVTDRLEFMRNPGARPMGAGRDLFLRRKDGVNVPVEIGLTPIETNFGRCALAGIVDISERKRAEERLIASNEALQEFAFVASHDLQEPLRTMTSYLELLKRELKEHISKDGETFLAFAADAAKRMKNLVADLLNYARLDTEPKKPVPVDCNAILRTALVNLKVAIEESGAKITSDPLPSVTGDREQLVRLFQNLIANSIKFHGTKVPEVHIFCRDQEGKHKFCVRDNGIGLDMADAKEIFVSFRRMHGMEEYAGSGLGLAICRKIVERHGGRIWVDLPKRAKEPSFVSRFPRKKRISSSHPRPRAHPRGRRWQERRADLSVPVDVGSLPRSRERVQGDPLAIASSRIISRTFSRASASQNDP